MPEQDQQWNRRELGRMGYQVETVERTYSPITAIWFDRENGTMWGGASDLPCFQCHLQIGAPCSLQTGTQADTFNCLR
jgi:hypothetical protein